MNIRTLRSLGLAFLLVSGAQVASAQGSQEGDEFNSVSGITVTDFRIMTNPTPWCTDSKRCQVVAPNYPLGLGVFPNNYFSLPAGNGPQSFEVRAVVQYADPMQPLNGVSVFIDDQFCSSCDVVYLQTPVIGTNPAEYRYLITHRSGSAFSTNGERRFTLRFNRVGSPAPVMDIRFGAIMVGEAYTDVLGYYNTPLLPLYILRDPPGGGSFSSITSSTNTCFGQSHSVSTSSEEGYWAKAKLGVAGEAGLFVTTEFELYGELGVSLSASRSETSEFEYRTCLQSTSTYTTANSGTPDDVFIVSANRYAYGMRTIIERPTCGTVTRSANFASSPVQRLLSQNWSESYIIGTVIPGVQQDIAGMVPGSPEYKLAVEQLSVWQQAIALNATIKANAPLTQTRSFNGGDLSFQYSETQTTSETTSIQYNAILEQGLTAEFGLEVGGSGVSAGGSIKMKNEYGNGETGSNESTNTLAYTLVDSDVFDNFTVEVRKDGVFGSNVFVLDSASSRTSCRYEGGFQLDQPSLSVGSPGNTSMTVIQAPIGSAVNFPLIVCNNSDITRTYYLRFSAATNAQGAILQAFGNTLNSNDNGIMLELTAGQCLNSTLSLTQPNAGVLDFSNINLYLYALCEEEYAPYIRSFVSVSAFYGAGNIGSICETSNGLGTIEGDFVDGVQLGSINNTGTGSIGGSAYTNYSTQFSSTLSRNGQYMASITSGEFSVNVLSAWIDFDQNGSFDPDELIGSFDTNSPYETTDLPFTVPADAVLGNTLMRVRTTYLPGPPPPSLDPCIAYDYGETEDYGIVINANTPQDCLGINNGTALPGTPCNDNNATTGNDTWNANCQCVGVPVDCAGVAGGSTVPGTPCDDGDPNTASDVYNANCQCVGQLIDCTGLAGGSALPGTPCNDGLASTGNDTWNNNCQCIGLPIDCAGVSGGNALPGTACNDGNPLSANDTYDSNCQCAGTLSLDCNGIPGGAAQPGTPCDDNDPSTGGDTFGANCVCAGLPFDCAGTPGGSLLPGTPCNDGNPQTTNDVFNANCSCVGELVNDCAGVPGGAAQPGTPCNDGNPNTGNDTWSVNCQCVGQTLDCTGIPGGFNLPGAPCDDGDETTGNDLWNSSCQCSGLPIDCEGVPGGLTLPGSGCDDGDPNTTNDIFNLNCVCAGTLALDCEGVAGGPAQPGTACDDGDPDTGDDIYNASCICAGLPLDCAGTPGGAVLPGTACNDGDPCTTNDVLGGDCTCSGTPLSVGTITAPLAADAGSTVTIFIAPLAGATNYQWTMPADWTSTNTGTFVLEAQVGSTIGAAEACVSVTANGCVVDGCTSVTVLDPNSLEDNTDLVWFTVQPNPSNGLFHLRPVGGALGDIDLQVYDASGREVWSALTRFISNPLAINLDGMDNGTYYLIAQRNGERRVMPLVLTR